MSYPIRLQGILHVVGIYSRAQKFKTTLLKINIFMKCCVMIHNHRKHVINFIIVEQSFILDYVLSKIVIQQVQEEIFFRVLTFIKSLKMGRKSSLTEVQRARIVLLNQEGYSERQISKAEKCSKTAVHNALAKFKNSGSYSDNKRSGRPRKQLQGMTASLSVLLCVLHEAHLRKCAQHY